MHSCCGRLALHFGKSCDIIFHTCGSKITCHFIGRTGGPFYVLGRRISCHFPTSMATDMPCMGTKGSNSCGKRFRGSFRGICAATPVSRLGGRQLVFLPLIIRTAPRMGIYVARASLGGCPKLCLAGTGNSGSLDNVRTPCPGAVGRNKRGGLRVHIRAHRRCVTGMSKPHGFP